MIKVDLITGFLGAGKTTFIHRYIEYWSEQGKRVRVIENEFGAVDVDSQLLKDDDCELDSLAGMCMCCSGKEAFRQMLIDAAESGCERVIVEPSGIYDVDEFFAVMKDAKVREACEIGSVITIVDGNIADSASLQEEYLIVSQLCASGKIILSKSQLYDEGQLADTCSRVTALMDKYSERKLEKGDILIKNWQDLTQEDMRMLSACGYRHDQHFLDGKVHEGVFTCVMAAGRCDDQDDLQQKIQKLMQDQKYGHVVRAKGYARDPFKQWYEVNAVADVIRIQPAQVRKGVLVVIGQELEEQAIMQLMRENSDECEQRR